MHNSSTTLPYVRRASLNRLLAEDDLELRLVSGTAASADRAMNGIHLTEILEVDRWLAEGWVLMTTGILLQRNPHAQRKLVRDLHRMNASGLGYCVDIVTRNVPAALLAEARELGFPLFVMPLHIKARDVATRANRMILANDDTLFQQALSTQDVFFERFEVAAETDWLPERQLVDNLAELLGLPVSFHSNDSGVPGDGDLVGQELLTAPTHAPIKQRSGAEELLIVPARVGAIFVGWVVVKVPPDLGDGQVAMNTTVAVARLVALAVLSRKRPASNDRSIRQELMGQLLGLTRRAGSGLDAVRYLGRAGTLSALQDLGFEPGQVVRGVVVEGGSGADLDAVLETLYRLTAPYVFVQRDATLTLMIQMPIDKLKAALEAEGAVTASVGGEIDSVIDIRNSLEQAEATLRFVHLAAGPEGYPTDQMRCVVFDELPMSAWMVHHDQSGSPVAKAERELAPLHSNQAVFDTVVAYFLSGLDVATCAEKLFLHPNSVRYRLRRAEEILRVSLHSPAAISDLYLMLRVLGEL